MRRSTLDILKVPPWPLDILAQQMVAACSVEEWGEDELYHLCLRAYPYRELPREKYDQVVEVLSRGFAPRQGQRGALLHRDGINRRLRGRRGAQIAALTNGGAIPDTADYDVIAEPEETFVGTVNEDFAIESLAGDVFLLGTTPWKIRRVESGRVRVEDAHGLSPSIPFWLGEAPGRTWELSQEVTDLREALDQRLDSPQEAEEWAMAEAGVSSEAARQLVAYLAEGKRVLGMVPTGRRIVAERFFDKTGGMQIVIHAPFGSRINRGWGMALRKRICRNFDQELQASATDDGLNFSLGPQLSFPVSEVFTYLSPRNVEGVLLQAALQSPLFGTRWRWNATRALAVIRHNGGRKVPPPLQRMRSDDLLAAVFPAQLSCQDNAAIPRDIEPPDHPLVFETLRDCLMEAMDSDGLKRVLGAIEKGDIEVYARDTVQPSVFAHQILNAMPYAFLDDAPLEERRARAVSLRWALPEDARELGALDPEAILTESRNAWPRVRDADELHEALLILGVLPKKEALREDRGPDPGDMERWFAELVEAGRAFHLRHTDCSSAWVAAEAVPLALAAYPEVRLEPQPPDDLVTQPELAQEDAIVALVRGWSECSGPFTPGQMSQVLTLPEPAVAAAVTQLEADGQVLRGRFRPEATEEEFCDRRILARIHRATISRLRRELEPVSQATFVRFLFRWQHAEPSSQLHGAGGLLAVIEKIQGYETAAGSWEPELLASRVLEYKPSLLDSLCLGGEVVWGRISRHQTNGDAPSGRAGQGTFSRSTPITLAHRESLGWLLDQPGAEDSHQSSAPKEVMERLAQKGASFLSDIAASTHRLPSDVQEVLWQLASAGRVTADSLDALRDRIKGNSGPRRRPSNRRRGRSYPPYGYGRWSLLEAVDPQPDPVEPRAHQLLQRYGILFPEVLAREPMAPSWRVLVRVLRRMEARGEIRGGRFVSGFVGEQFAFPEAVETLRAVKNSDPQGQLMAVSACDPLNVVGILTPGDRVPTVIGNRVVYRDGVPICSLENGTVVNRVTADEDTLAQARTILHHRPPRAGNDGARSFR